MTPISISTQDNVNNNHMNNTSIPLIYLTNNSQQQSSNNNNIKQKFILNSKAIQLIQSYNLNNNNQTTFISICGDYRTGKSFLMNSLFFSKQGFKVSPTTQPCTKGINIWSKPITYNGKNIWILDTQGFGAIDRDDSYDIKIFLLTTLISDIVMYNSFGALDQNTINKFAAICHKAQSLDKGLKQIKMFWILRDFSLSIQNKQGKLLTADQYLQNALLVDNNTGQQSSRQHGRISSRQTERKSSRQSERTAIKKVFGQRHCIPLVRPVIDENILSQLSEIKFQQLRGQFVQQVYKLRKKLLTCIESKVIQGVKITAQNLTMFINKYLQLINTNQLQTDISCSWQKIVQYEKQKEQAKIKLKLRQLMNKQSQKIPFNIQMLCKIIQHGDKLIIDEVKQFQKHFTDKQYIKQTQQNLLKYISQTRQLLITKNIQHIRAQQKKCVKLIFDNVQKQVGKQSKVDDSQLIQKYIEKLFKTKDQYMAKFSKYLQKDKKLFNNNNTSLNNSNAIIDRKYLSHINQLITQSSQLIYYEHFYQQQKLTFPKIIGQLSQQLATTISKMNQIRKSIKLKDNDIKILAQQKQKLIQQKQLLIQQKQKINKQLSKTNTTKQQLTKQLQLKHHQISTLSTQQQNNYLQIKAQYQQNIQQLKQTILNLEKDFLTIKKQNQLEKLEYQDKYNLVIQRNQLLAKKLQQCNKMNQNVIEQLKEQYQQKIKKQQQKYLQLQNNLNLQRKKFLQLNKTKKEQQGQLLQDLAQKNEKLLAMRRQMTNIEHIYKQQLQSIINQQRTNLQQQYYLQLQQKQHLIHVLQQKLQQCLIRLQQLQQLQKKYQTILMQHRLLTQQHLNVVDKYKQIVNKLKKNTQQQQQKDNLFQEIKQKYQLQIKSKQQILISKQQLLNSKQQLLKKFKLQIKSTQQQKHRQIEQLQARQLIEISQLKQQLQQQYQSRLKSKISTLESTHKQQKSQLLEELKQCYNEIQGIKLGRGRLQSELRQVSQMVVRMNREYKVNDKQVRAILRKYKKISKQSQLSLQKQRNQQGIIGNNNNKQSSNINNRQIDALQFDKIQQNISIVEQSSILQQSNLLQSTNHNQQQQQLLNNHHIQQSSSITNNIHPILSGQSLQQLQSQFIQILQLNKSLTQQSQDLKHSFKQTILQLQQCQSHINNLNNKISIQQQQLSTLSQTQSTLSLTQSQLQSTKKELHTIINKLQSIQKSNQLLKKQIQLRDQIHTKRQSSIKENLLLYKQTIANLTLQNQHLLQKSTKLQIELNRFVQWESDFIISNQNNNRERSNLGSYQYLQQNNDNNDDMFSFGQKISRLQKQNRKLKKQLYQQKQLSIIELNNNMSNNNNKISSTTNLTNILTQNNQLQSLKKQSLLYKKRVQELRQRELKLLQEMKNVKLLQKQSAQGKVNLIRQQFQGYRKKSKLQIVQLQKKIDQLTQEKYKLKQQILLIKQDRSSYLLLSANKSIINHTNQQQISNNNNNNNPDNNNNNTTKASSSQQQSIQTYQKTIQSLTKQNTKLQLQLTTINSQLIKQKDQYDKKIASLQIFYQDQIRLLQNQKSRIDLQNQKNKTKYQHLLKVNNELIIEIDNFKAKANNQLTLKEKYKHKISALFIDDDD